MSRHHIVGLVGSQWACWIVSGFDSEFMLLITSAPISQYV